MNWAIALLTFATAVFRSELLLLLGPLALQAALFYTSFYDVVRVGLIAGLISAGECIFEHGDNSDGAEKKRSTHSRR